MIPNKCECGAVLKVNSRWEGDNYCESAKCTCGLYYSSRTYIPSIKMPDNRAINLAGQEESQS